MAHSADVVVVGAGAAGLATAIFVARQNPSRSIVILNGSESPGAKILISGGGRCNLTNAVVTPADYRGGSPNVIRRVLQAFPVEQTVAFFREIGVRLREEPGGKLFPATSQARTVLEALLGETRRLGIGILAGHPASHIERQAERFHVITPVGRVTGKSVVLATGGLSLPETGCDGSGYRLARNLGHSLVPTTPALVPLSLDGDFHEPLSGISQGVELTVRADGAKPIRLRGSLLWTHFGVSGPVALDASRFWHRAHLARLSVTVSVNFLPGDDLQAAERRLILLASLQPRTLLRNALSTLLPSRVADAILSAEKIDGRVQMARLARGDRCRLARSLLEWPLNVRDSRGYQHAEVTAGGIPLSEIDPRTMGSRKCPGLYLAGEMLDVDGRIGGFNLQWAWSSAWVAARGISSGSKL
jgi:predicted Rossmann fold flavoprotein